MFTQEATVVENKLFTLLSFFDHDLFYNSCPVTENNCDKIHSPFLIIEQKDFHNRLGIFILSSENILAYNISDLYRRDVHIALYVKTAFSDRHWVNTDFDV